jgi:hypothetical protein
MKNKLPIALLVSFNLIFIKLSYGQLPATNFFYYANTGAAQMYNYNTTTGISTLNTISLPAGNIGLAVNNNFFAATPAMTYYTIVGSNFYYYNGSTWVNTGHTLSDPYAVNIGGAGPYIYCYSGFGGQVYRYNGTGAPVLVITLASSQGPYDVTGDASGNFFVMKTNAAPMSLKKYSSTGVLQATYTMTGFPAGTAGGGFAFINGKLYADISGVTVWGTISGTNITYGGPLTLSTSSGDLANWPLPIVPLPVELLSFSGKYNQEMRMNAVEWTTSVEVNNDYFSVEFSENGVEWNWLVDVTGAGNSNQEENYSIQHDSPFQTTYYRLKQTDMDGAYKYYDPITVARPLDDQITIYPNPATNVLNISAAKGIDSYQIYDEAGRIMMKSTNSTGLHQLDISFLQPGIYLFSGSANGETQHIRFIKN